MDRDYPKKKRKKYLQKKYLYNYLQLWVVNVYKWLSENIVNIYTKIM